MRWRISASAIGRCKEAEMSDALQFRIQLGLPERGKEKSGLSRNLVRMQRPSPATCTGATARQFNPLSAGPHVGQCEASALSLPTLRSLPSTGSGRRVESIARCTRYDTPPIYTIVRKMLSAVLCLLRTVSCASLGIPPGESLLEPIVARSASLAWPLQSLYN